MQNLWRKAGEASKPLLIFFSDRHDVKGRRIGHELAKEQRGKGETIFAEAFADEFEESLGENFGVTGNVRLVSSLFIPLHLASFF